MEIAVKAYQVRVNDTLDPAKPGDRRQTVNKILTTPEGLHIFTMTPTGQHYEHVFAYQEEVAFPRRVPAKVHNWIGQSPNLNQLYVGDLVDPHFPGSTDPRVHPEWFGDTQEELDEALKDYVALSLATHHYQIVERISAASGSNNGIFTVYVRSLDGRRNRYLAAANSPVHIPDNDVPIRKKRPPVTQTEVIYYGPYVHAGTDTSVPVPADQLVWFATHPTGRGRWPSFVPEYNPGGVGRMRPPHAIFTRARQKEEGMQVKGLGNPLQYEWNRWEGLYPDDDERFTPHPRDLKYSHRSANLVESKLRPGVLAFRKSRTEGSE